tara:strand:- start:1397 stop:2332 length:936 start_codon:yes stop_codon:yes gene_type:complete
MQQITNNILMIRPANFNYNDQTASNNYYQKRGLGSPESINENAQKEFDLLVKKLKSNGINVLVFDDDLKYETTDAVFPNNWISFHSNGDIAIYPMFAINRRLERREDVFSFVENKGFNIKNVVDYTSAEDENLFLEGTGSMVLDRVNRKAYCSISERSSENLLIEFCEDFQYTPVIFNSFQNVQGQRLAIYHTNVMMCVAETFAIVCLDSVDNEAQRKTLTNQLIENGKEIIEISEDQLENFSGNMLQLKDSGGNPILVMSESAHKALNKLQIDKIQKHCNLLYSPIPTIERCGGGSVRCMIAEVFLPISK